MTTKLRCSLALLALLSACANGASTKPVAAPTPVPHGQRTATGNADVIRVDAPKSGALIGGSLRVTGAARGPWYFEATFPVRVLDARGNTVVESYAQAQGEWMTEAYVPFTVELKLGKSAGGSGTLVLEKSNASGLPEHADELRVPVRFWPP
jgi:hypothetical protein